MPEKHPINDIAEHCLQRIQFLLTPESWDACQCVIVGYSGGLDSSVLLQALAHLRDSGALGGRTLKAVHINHGLSEQADQWQEHCRQQAEGLAIEFHSAKVEIGSEFLKREGGMEAAARKARYQIFEKLMGPDDVLLQAHHQDDQAETLLLRLMRGAGPKGLAGIPPCRALAKGQLVRPLLDLDKETLHAAALALDLSWVEDPSNKDTLIERNYLRREVMPLLETRWPGFAERWAATADLCQQSEDHLEQYQLQELAACDWRSERLGRSLCLNSLKALPETSQMQLIRAALSQLGLTMPSRAQLSELKAQILDASRQDSEAMVHTGSCSFAAHKNRLFCWPQGALPERFPEKWLTEQALSLGNGWELIATEVEPSELGLWLMPELELHGRETFKRAQPVSRQHSQSTKKLLQEQGLEPWLRDHIPFVAYQGQLLAVGDLWVEKAGRQHCEALPGARYCQVIWHHGTGDE